MADERNDAHIKENAGEDGQRHDLLKAKLGNKGGYGRTDFDKRGQKH